MNRVELNPPSISYSGNGLGAKGARMIGKRFGRLVVLSAETYRSKGSGHLRRVFVCLCDCGSTKTVLGHNLIGKATISCGCAKKDLDRTRTESRIRDTAEHVAWKQMRGRCNVKSHPGYKDYGGRGIKICKRWDVFAIFLSDMGKRPSAKHSIDRINNNSGYKPSNCQWSLQSQQARNRRTTLLTKERVIEGRLRFAKGEKASKLAVEYGVHYETLRMALKGQTWKDL